MNAFSAYADEKVYTPVRPRKEKAPSALDLKMEEKQRLNKTYRRWKAECNRAAVMAEPRLVGFMRYLRSVHAEHAQELLEAVRTSWLVTASQDVRIFALRMISARCDKINREFGVEALDDPLPPETNVYFQARELLHAGGRA
ncbi:MAG: hypothetical protein ABW169_13375 [Sphingobium sp.]